MAQSKKSRDNQRGEPQGMDADGKPAKRRRVDKPDDKPDDWDESFSLTQQELETLNIIESQAVCETDVHPATLVHLDPDEMHAGTRYETAVSAAHDRPAVFQVPSVAGVSRPRIKSSASSSSSSSVYPKSDSSFSLRKTPSTDCSSAPGSLTASKSDSSHHSSSKSLLEHSHQVSLPVTSGACTDSNVNNTATMKEELKRKTNEVEQAKRELYVRDGEVKYLQEMLHRQEAEMEKLREERDGRVEQHAQHQREKEQALKAENERLQTLIEFKTQDFKRLQERCQNLEERLKEVSVAGPSVLGSQGSPSKSPRPRRAALGRCRTPERGEFPSRQSFMSDVETSGSRSRENAETMTESVVLDHTLTDKAGAQQNAKQRRLQLHICHSAGTVTGSQILSQLLQCTYSPAGDMSDNGIIGLLQKFTSRLDLVELQYKRDLATCRLSPIKRCFSTETKRTTPATIPTAVEYKPVVPKEHFLYAFEGLQSLLHSEQTEQTSGIPQLGNMPQAPAVRTSPNGCILILPLLNDYLGHYIDIVSSPVRAGCASPGSVSSPSSYESSLESMTASLEVLFQEGAEYANNMEALTLSALKVLCKLLCLNQGVRTACLQSKVIASVVHPAGNASSSSLDTDQDANRKTDDSGMEGDDEKNETSSSAFESPGSLASPVAQAQELDILRKLIRLAAPGHERSRFNKLIVQESLHALTVLAEKSTDLEVGRLYVVFLRGVLSDCLNLDGQPSIWIGAMQLFAQLVRAPVNLPAICNRSDNCTLLSIHMTLMKCLSSSGDLSGQLLSVFCWVIECLSAVISLHQNGVSLIMANSCRCSAQVIPSLLHAMCRLLQDHRTMVSDGILGGLHKGVTLLHVLSLGDPLFQMRYSPVRASYSSLMFNLTLLYKKYPHIPHPEVSALEELWDYEQEDSDMSQDGR